MKRNVLIITVLTILLWGLMGTFTAMAKDYVGLLICGDTPKLEGAGGDSATWNNGVDKEKGFDEFWNDTFLQWEILYNYGYADEDIHVLFGWGDDWWVSWPRYRADQDSFPTGITDTSACYDDVTDILTALADGDSSQGIEAMTSDDIFFCWTFDHGGPLYPDSMYVYLCLMDGVIWDTTFARYANPIQCQRRTFWMQQCHSGGFKDDLGDSSTVFISACDWDEVAYRADDKDTSGNPVDEHEVYNDTAYHHGEFDYHVMNAVRGETPNGDPIDADIDGDGLISMDEVWNWEYYHDSWYRYIHYPTPQYVDLGNLGSETYLNTGEVVSGHITSNTTWESDATIYVRGDVVVDSGVTLTIEDGATVIFSTDFDSEKSGADTSSCELIVYGTLYAWGTASDSIVFTSNASSPSQGDWYGIVQKNSSSNSSKIDHCQIKYAHKGFSCYKCSADVRMTTFNNCDYGAYVDTAATKLFLYRVTCTNCSYGLRVQEGKAWLLDNNFTHNDIGIGYFSAKHYFPGGPSRNADIKGCDVKYNTKGIFVDDCSPIINHCFIDSNSLWGIKCTGDSDPILGRDTLMYNGVGSKAMNMPGPTKSNPPPQEHKGGLSCLGTSCPIVCTGAVSGPYVRGRNVIKDNNGRGVYCGGQSNPKLGACVFPGLSPGYNSLGDNVGYDVCNVTGSTVIAQANWWGEAPPDTSEIYGPVNTDSYLESEPSKGAGFGGSSRFAVLDSRIRGAGGFSAKSRSSDSKGTAEEYNELGTYYLLNLMYDSAIETFQHVLTNFSDCAEANYALDHLIQCYQEGGYQTQINSYLVNLSSSTTNQELKKLAFFLNISQLCREGKYGQAMSQCQTLLGLGCDDEMEKSLRFRVGMLYRYGLGDDESAIVAFQRFIDKYPEDPLSSLAKVELEILGVSPPPKTEPGAPAAKPIKPLPKTFVLHQNYPNPFNAQTCIEYELPKEAQVSLRIYNILGQRVKTLADDLQPAGHYQLTWDGRNNQGIRVGSGIYFVRLEAGTYALTRKIVLLR